MHTLCRTTRQRAHRNKPRMNAVVPAATPVIYREVTFSLAAFDGLKDWQRHFERSVGQSPSNGEELDRLLLTHPAPK